MGVLKWVGWKPGPPSPADAMSRTIILKYQIVTGLATPPPEVLASLRQSSSVAEQQEFLEEDRQRRAGSEDALRETGLWSQMSPTEQAFMRTALTAVTPQMLRDVSWLMESFECLLWALGYLEEMPPYDSQADTEHLNLLPPLAIGDLVRGATLRPAQIILAARDVAELWHWRSRTRQLQESGTPGVLPAGLTLDDVVRMAAEKAAASGVFEAPIESDFPVFGRSYRRASPQEWHEVTSIAMERHRALNWLCGYAGRNRWQETPTDT
jgi:hypothetical protein